jgi:hypothetical protein
VTLPVFENFVVINSSSSSVNVDPTLRERIQPHHYCRNGQLVSPTFQSMTATLANQITALRPKELASFCGDPEAPMTNVVWRFACHTSPNCGAIVARLIITKAPAYIDPDTLVGPVNANPMFELALYEDDVSETYIDSKRVGGGIANGETLDLSADEWTVQTIILGSRALNLRDRDIRGVLNGAFGGNLIGAVVYECARAPLTENGYIAQQYSIGQGIYDTDRQDVADTAVDLWKRGAAPLFTFSSYRDATAPASTLAAASPANIFDISVVTVTPETPGYFVDLRWCNTKARTTVPCRFEAYFKTGGGVTLEVQLKDSTGATVGTLSGGSTFGAWFQTEIELPPTLAKYDLMFTYSGLNGLTLYEASLYQYLD